MKQVFYAPERGDVVLMSFAPASGPTRPGRRPAVVLSPQAYNARVGLALVCPIVTEVKGYPFEVLLPPGSPAEGAVLADQAMSLDWRESRVEKAGDLSASVIAEVVGKLKALLEVA
jgi:mRNA interferase MazF